MTLLDELRFEVENQGFNLIDLRNSPNLLQKFLESVPEFFMERQGSPAGPNEANIIISSLPPGVNVEDKLIFGIKDKNILIAFCEIILNFPSPEILLNESERVKDKIGNLASRRFTISFLVIRADYRNKGLGKTSMAFIERILFNRGYEYSHLVVNESNIKAKSFYERNQYHMIKETQQSIGNKRHNCFVMMKNLGPTPRSLPKKM